MRICLDLAKLLEKGVYSWETNETEDLRVLRHVIFCEEPASNHYQSMNIFAPSAYFNADGSVDRNASVNGYTPDTAPIVFRNNCSGWMSSDPDRDWGTFLNKDCAKSGYIYVSCGARSRDLGKLGKVPAPVVDLKAGIRFLRRNREILPGCMDRIISIGGSGAGQMSSVIGATGNHPDYLPWLYEIGAAGVDRLDDGSYISSIRDDVYGCMCFYPITDLENADLAYAWTRFDSGETYAKLGGGGMQGLSAFSEFKLALQRDMARRYAEYINSLQLKTAEGEPLGFSTVGEEKDLRRGLYYEKILENLSRALNAFLAEKEDPEQYIKEHYTDGDVLPFWLEREEQGYRITDMAGFLNGTGLKRNKDIPGFDTFWKTAENNAFGGARDSAVHYSASNAAVLRENLERYRQLPGFDACDVEEYIRESGSEIVKEQTGLMNSTHLLMENARTEKKADVAPYWRIRSGTADEHTAFSIGYNLALAAMENPGVQVDYSLVWDMKHGGEVEGTSTGTFFDWAENLFK